MPRREVAQERAQRLATQRHQQVRMQGHRLGQAETRLRRMQAQGPVQELGLHNPALARERVQRPAKQRRPQAGVQGRWQGQAGARLQRLQVQGQVQGWV